MRDNVIAYSNAEVNTGKLLCGGGEALSPYKEIETACADALVELCVRHTVKMIEVLAVAVRFHKEVLDVHGVHLVIAQQAALENKCTSISRGATERFR